MVIANNGGEPIVIFPSSDPGPDTPDLSSLTPPRPVPPPPPQPKRDVVEIRGAVRIVDELGEDRGRIVDATVTWHGQAWVLEIAGELDGARIEASVPLGPEHLS